MNRSIAKQRFDELDVARALGDISPKEQQEYLNLQKEFQFEPDRNWDSFVSSVEGIYACSSEKFSAEFTDKVVATFEKTRQHSKPSDGNSGLDPIPKENQAQSSSTILAFITHPSVGWIAACLAVLFIIYSIEEPVRPVSLAEKRYVLTTMEETIQLPFFSTTDKKEALGDVVWNSSSQQGYMRLAKIKANDPSKSQYQLWIVDPSRDEKPVDGGVFNLSSEEETIIPIDAALAANQPVAFVITEEQPGGVVVSKQEKVIAIAALTKN